MMTPAFFFATEPLRARLSRRPQYAAHLARELCRSVDDVRTQLDTLEAMGCVSLHPKGYALTDSGEVLERWAAPPPDDLSEEVWIAGLVRAIAAHHEIDVHAVLTANTPEARRARARLSFAIYGRGWSFERIDVHLGMARGSARDGVERWRRRRSLARSLRPTVAIDLEL